MFKTTSFIFVLVLLLTLTLTQLASANFTVANDSNTKVSAIYGYWDGDKNLFRIRGYYHIQPNQSKSLWAPANVTKVFARIWTRTDVVKHDRDNYSSSNVHPKKAFDVFYKRDGTIVQSNVPRNELVKRADFYQYDNNTTFRYKSPVEDVSGPGPADVSVPTGDGLTFTKRDGTALPTQMESGDQINLVVKLAKNGFPITDALVNLKITPGSITKAPTLAVTKKIGEDGTVVTGGAFTGEVGVNTNAQGEIPITMQLDLVATGTFKLTAFWAGAPAFNQPPIKKELSIQAAVGPGAKAKSMDITASTNSYISRTPSNSYIVEPMGGKFKSGTIPLTFKLISETDDPLPGGNFLATVSTTKGSVAAQFEVDTSNPDKRNVNLKTGSKDPLKGIKKVNLKLTNASTGDLTVTGRISKGGKIVTAATLNIVVRPTLHNLSVSGIGDLHSGKSRSVTATVYSKNGNKMPGVSIKFIENTGNLRFSTSSGTPSSGVLTTSLQAKGKSSGSWRNVDSSNAYYSASPYSVSVSAKRDGVTKSKNFSVSVKPWKVRTSRSWWIDSEQASCGLWVPKKCIPFTNICNPAFCSWFKAKSQRSWGNNEYADFGNKVVNIVDVDGEMSWGDRQVGATAYITSSKISGSKVYVYGTIETHYLDSNNYEVEVTAQYEWVASSFNQKIPSGASAGAPPLRPELQPDTHQLSDIWQELSQVPARTALLPNYPNPFNPETWIPYQLAKPADVTLRIYSAGGKLVQTLALGYQAAGMYESKSRAAYWDGRNSVGERVASGLYFYTLTAGDFAATGKMLIMK